MELNLGFDGKLTPKIEAGAVTELDLLVDDVTDLSAICVFSKLKRLRSVGSNARSGTLSDLTPLRGMSLTFYSCFRTKVSDLSPLQGMPLQTLWFSETPVSDLSSLRGMLLTNIHCYGTQVVDLSPLEGMRLAGLDLAQTPVADLSALLGCQTLKVLKITETKVTPAGVVALARSPAQLQDRSGRSDGTLIFTADPFLKLANTSPTRQLGSAICNSRGIRRWRIGLVFAPLSAICPRIGASRQSSTTLYSLKTNRP